MKLKLIFLFILFLLNPVFAEEGYYSLSYNLNSIVASIELNGIMQTEPSNEGFKSGVATGLNIWVMPGENTLKIKLLKPYAKGKNPSDPKIKVYIRFGQAGQTSDEGKEIVSFVAPEVEGDNITFPFEKEIKFTPAIIPPSELWTKAEKVELDDPSKKEIAGIIQALYKASNSGNKKDFLKLNEFKLNDIPKSMYANQKEDKARDQKSIGEFLKLIKGKMEKIPTKLTFVPVANGNIIYVTDAKGDDIIKTKGNQDDGAFKTPVYVAKIDGKWTLVR